MNGEDDKKNQLEGALRDALKKIGHINAKLGAFSEPIAIIGLGCRFPGHSKNPDQFWELLKNGIDGISDIPSDRFDIDDYYDPEPGKPEKIITKKGAFIDDIDLFDPSFFGISQIEAKVMDPQQRLLLHLTWEALESAGIAPASLKNSSTGVFIGVSSNEYGDLISKNTGNLSPNFASGNALNGLSGRISYCFGFQGPSLIVDTACSSSLVALHTACKSLLSGDCQLAIAGGVNIILDPATYVSLSSGQMLSPEGHCKTFDASADGYARGEGIGVLILKRLSQAKREGDRILAVIRGSAVNQDGPSSGLTVPNGVAQAKLIRKALKYAKLNPQDIGFVEAHGTGTSLGDPIEVGAIAEVYGESRSPENPLWIGSVKSNIGHLESAAGMSSMIKMILALNHQAIPGNLHFQNLNPKIDLQSIPAKILTELTPWVVKEGQKRIAGISGFGFTGTNAHIILEEAPQPERKEFAREEPSLHLLLLSARSQKALHQMVKEYQSFLENTSETLGNIVYTASIGRNQELFRLAVIAKNLEELKFKLKNSQFSEGEADPNKEIKIRFQYQDREAYQIQKSGDNSINIEIGAHPDWAALLNELSSYYIAGAEIDWKEFYSPFSRNKITLPTYPFEYQAIWSELAVVEKPGIQISTNRHPFLVRRLITPGMKDIIYESTIDFHWPEFVSHHLIYDYPVIAGAGYISALLSAIKELSENGSGIISDLNWIRPLVFSKGEVYTLQIILHPQEENHYEFEVVSRKKDEDETLDSEWLTHASGQVQLNIPQEKLPEDESIETIQSRLKTHYEGPFLYNEVTPKISLDLGPHFRWIEAVNVSENEILAKMRFPESGSESDNYLLYPGFIDSVFQTEFAFMLLSGNIDILSIPLFIEKISYDSRSGYPRWIHAKKRREENEELTDFILFNERGEVIGEFHGFRTRAVPKEALLRAHGDVASLFYEWIWSEIAIEEMRSPDPLGHWLVLSDGQISDEFVKLFENKGASLRRILAADHPKNKEAFIELLKSEDFSGILHAASTGDVPLLTSGTIKQAQTLGAQSLLHLSQALVELGETVRIPLFLVTKNLSSGGVVQSPINGFSKTLLLEHPELLIKQIDLRNDWDYGAVFQCLFAKNNESIMAVENNRVFVPRFLRAKNIQKSENEINLASKIRKEATYLITGGLGGLGLALTKFLAEKGATNLVLTGRRALDDEIKSTLKNFETANIKITYESLDIGDEKSVSNLLGRLEKNEKPLKGIFHLAGVLDDATLMEQDWNHFEKVFRPKVYGSFYLHQYSKDLDLFVMFSSIASSLGNPGQINYAAANAFMDALCEYRQKQGLPAHSLSWGPWAEVGMAKDLVSRHAKSGMLGLKPKEGMRALEIALFSDKAHITVANIHWKNYLKQMIEAPSWLEAFAAIKMSKENLLLQLGVLPVNEHIGFVKNTIANIVRSVLGISSSQAIDEKKGFFDMGLDSLMAVQLKNNLQAELGKSAILASTVVFDHPSIEKMALHISTLLKLEGIKLRKPEALLAPVSSSEPIAIIGLGCRFPAGGNSPEEFWNFLESGRDGISEVPKERFDVDAYYDPEFDVPGKMYTRKGGFLNTPVDLFDNDFFGISPREAEFMDPQQRLLLEVVWEALEDAMIPPETLEGTSTGVFVGFMTADYSDLIKLSSGLEGMTPYVGPGNSYSASVGRVSYFLGLQGPCLAIETACSSSLVAINSACESLRLGQCQQAIVGGVNLILGPSTYILECQMHMLSPDGHSKSFDKAADGYARAEGCGVVILKPLSQAKRDGDKIYAVIKGSGVNQNGSSSGLTVPNGEAQASLMNQVLKQAGLRAGDIDYIEAHGTGTSLGDPIEVRAIGETYGQRDMNNPLFLGTVKSNFGHAEGAAGVAGLIKTVLSLKHQILPPNLNFKELNPHIELNFPVKILTEKTPWPKSKRIRRAGVSSFGFSGINAHVILEEPPEIEFKEAEIKERPIHILTLSAKSDRALEDLLQRYITFLEKTEYPITDICYSANVGRNHEYYRLAIIAKNIDELRKKMESKEFIRGEAKAGGNYEIPEIKENAENWIEELAKAYVMGAKIDWKKFDSPYARQRVSLPTYPFQRKRYWTDFIKKDLAYSKSDVFYKTEWVEAPISSLVNEDLRKILILTLNSNSSVLSDIFKSNPSCEIINEMMVPNAGSDVRSMLETILKQTLATDLLVDASSMEEIPSLQEGLLKLLYTIQSVVQVFKNIPFRIYFLTSNNPMVFEAVRSMQLSILQEYPTLALIHGGSDISTFDIQKGILEKIFFEKDQGNAFLSKEGRIFIPKLIRVENELKNQTLKLSSEGVYLITGGLGAIGRKLAEWLLQNGAGNVVVTGRKPFVSQEEKIKYLEMDVSDFDSVRSTLKVIQESIGELKGIFHLAGVLKDDLLMKQTEEHFFDVFAPKLMGSWNLHKAAESYSLDYFVLFSSVASTLGSAGQINYATANGFMNGLAEFRQKQGLPGESIAWGPWAGVGMAAELNQRLEQLGFGSFSFDEGMAYLKTALLRSEPVLTCSSIFWNRYLSQYSEVPIWLLNFVEKKEKTRDILSKLHYGDYENNTRILEEFITETIKKVLGAAQQEFLDPQKNFYDMGMDSLMIMSIANQLQAALKNPDITPALLIENPTLRQLNEVLQSLLGILETPPEKTHVPSVVEIMNSSAWITEISTHKKPSLRIFCFAHAGGGKSLFSSWRSALPDSIGLCLAQLPGREDRIHEPMILTQEQIISSLVNHMIPYLGEPYVLVGHSFGALLCYDVMVELQHLGLPIPLHAFLSSYDPQMQHDFGALLNLPQEAFLKEIQEQFQGLPQSVLNDKNLQKILFPALKADFHYMAEHPPLEERILKTSITTLCGDAEKITSLDMKAWEKLTLGEYDHHMIPGGHFMIIDQQNAYLKFLINWIGKMSL